MRSIVLLLCLHSMYNLNAQEPLKSCDDLKGGTFYSYPLNSNDNWKCERTGEFQKDINLTTGDTLVFKVKWNKGCSYTLTYHSGGKKMDAATLQIIKQNPFVYTVTEHTPEFYVATSYLGSTKNFALSRDTMWSKPQQVSNNRILFVALTPAEQQKTRLKDTSQFALLYLYRPSKFVCGGVGYPLYANDVLAAVFPAHGGAAYAYKVLQPGKYRFFSEHGKSTDQFDLEILPGKKYYIRVDTKWSAARCRPFLSEVDKPTGESEFLDIR